MKIVIRSKIKGQKVYIRLLADKINEFGVANELTDHISQLG